VSPELPLLEGIEAPEGWNPFVYDQANLVPPVAEQELNNQNQAHNQPQVPEIENIEEDNNLTDVEEAKRPEEEPLLDDKREEDV